MTKTHARHGTFDKKAEASAFPPLFEVLVTSTRVHPDTGTTPDSWLTAKSGTWATGADWSTGKSPTTSNDATIAVSGKYTVTISAAAAANSLTITDSTATVLNNSTLSLSGSLAVTSGTFSLASGASLVGATVTVGSGSFLSTGGTFSNVAYDGTLNLASAGAALYLAGGDTFAGASGSGPGTVNLTGNNAVLYTPDSTTLNNATINIGGTGLTDTIYLYPVNTTTDTLTLGPSLDLVQANQTSSAVLNLYSGPSSGFLVNQGTISASSHGGTFNVYNAGSQVSGFTNSGSVVVSNGDLFEVSNVTSFSNQGSITVGTGATLNFSSVGSFTNSGQISATGSGTVVDFGGTWTNTGTLAVASSAVLNLGGTFTLATLSTVNNSGGQINITGDLINTGTTFTVGGAISLSTGGEILGGTVIDTSGQLSTAGGTLSGVTYDGTLNLSSTNAAIYVAGTNTFAGANGTGTGTINVTGSNAVLYTADNTTLNRATLNLGGTSDTDTIYLYPVNTTTDTLTLGASLALSQASSNSDVEINLYAGPTSGFLVNQGSINAAAKGGQFNIYNDGQVSGFTNTGNIAVSNGDQFVVTDVTNVVNQGSVAVSGGATLDLSSVGSFANSGVMSATGTGTVVDFGGVWTNTGTLNVSSGAVLNLGGTFTLAALSTINSAGGLVDITGDLVNTGTTYTPGTNVSLSGTITGGTVADPNGQLTFVGGTLSGVAYQGTLSLAAAGASVSLAGTDTFAGASGTGTGTILDTGNNANLITLDDVTLDNATIDLGNATTSYLYIESSETNSATLTLGAHLSLTQTGASAQVFVDTQGNGTDALVNNGTISAAVANGSFDIYGQAAADRFTNAGQINVSDNDTFNASNVVTFVNAGLITVTSQGTLDLGGAWSSTGTINLAGGGTLNTGGTFTTATLNSVLSTGGVVNLGGDLVNTGATYSPGANVNLVGTITGGTVIDATGQLYFDGGTLSNVAYQGTLSLAAANADVFLTGTDTFANASGTGTGTILDTGVNSYVYLTNTGTVNNATLDLGNNTQTDYLQVESTSGAVVVTLGSTFNVVQSGQYADISIDQQNTGNTLINAGTITADNSAGSLAISGIYSKDKFTNTGSLIATAHGTLDLSSATLTNLAAGTLTLGSYEADAGSTIELANNAVVSTDSATIILNGAGATIQSLNTNTSKQVTLDQKLAAITATGELALLGGRNLTTSGTLSDSGALLLGGGTLTTTGLVLATGAHLGGTGTVAGPITNNAGIEATAGTLALAGSISGTGAALIDAHATLDLQSGASASQTVTFGGLGATLRLDNPAAFAAPLAGFGPGNALSLGTLTATAVALSGTSLAITLTGGTVLNETLTTAAGVEHLGISSDGHTITAYREASASAHAPEPVAFGNHHVGDAVSQAVTLTNTAAADGYSEALDASIGAATGAATAAGAFTGLAAGATNTTSLTVGLNTTAAGTLTGTATINLASDGTGIDGAGTTTLGTQTVNVTGAVYAYAAGQLANGGTLALGQIHVGGSATAALGLTNVAATGGYSEALDAALGAATGAGFATTGSLTGLAAGASNTTALDATFTSAQSGAFTGQATLGLVSDGTGIDGLGTTTLAGQTVTLTGTAYAYAAPTLASTTVRLAVTHVGSTDQQALAITNSAAANGYSESLDAAFSSLSGAVTASGSVSLLSAGSTDGTDLVLGVGTSASGTYTGTAVLGLVSDGTGVDSLGTTTLAGQTITVIGIVDTYAQAAFTDGTGPAISGSGTQFAINLGQLSQGATADTISLGALNAASGLSDLLGGTLSSAGGAGFTNTGFGTFSGLAAGQSETAQSVTLSTSSVGTFSETVVLTSAGSNASGYNGALPTETLTITGTVISAGTSTSNTYALATGPNIVTGAAGGDLFLATAGSLNSRDQLTGGNGYDVLQLTGGGSFDVGAPKVFSNIPVIVASEGQAAHGTLASTLQTVYLRDGSNEALSVTAGTAASGNSNPEGITVYGGTGSDSLTLAGGQDSVVLYTGTDTITLGGAANSVTAGGGTAFITGAIATAAAAIQGNASSQTTLTLSTAGTATLNAADTYLTVNLAASSKLTLGGMAFITASGAAGHDTITAGGINQTLVGGASDVLNGSASGTDTFLGASAALNGDTIGKWTTGDVIDLTDMNSASLKPLAYASSKLTVSDGTHTSVITFSTPETVSNFTVLGPDGHGGTLIGFNS